MPGMLFLFTHVEPQYVSAIQEILTCELETYKEEPVPYWETIPDTVWSPLSENCQIQAIASEIMRDIFARYEDIELGDPIYIVGGEGSPTEVILALADELENSYDLLPAVSIMQVDPETLEVTRGDRKDLPLRLRLMYGDPVVLLLDMWTNRAGRDAGDPPDCPRGMQMRVVYRQAEGMPSSYFAAAYGTGEETVGLVLPWSIVMASVDWEADPPPAEKEGNWTAISALHMSSPYGLFCWYVDVDERVVASTEPGPWVLPFFQGYTVDAKLRQFHTPNLTETIPFGSERGQALLLEMRAHGLSTASVPLASDLGQHYYEEVQHALQESLEKPECGTEAEKGHDQ